MKIKTDFVTNSSSTAYIVAIPEDFVPNVDRVLERFKYHNQPEWGQWDDKTILLDFYECLDLLITGDNLWYYGGDGTDSRIFYTMSDICEENNFLLSVFEVSGEGNNRIEGIKAEDLNKWFMNTQLQKITVEVPDEQN